MVLIFSQLELKIKWQCFVEQLVNGETGFLVLTLNELRPDD